MSLLLLFKGARVARVTWVQAQVVAPQCLAFTFIGVWPAAPALQVQSVAQPAAATFAD